MCEDEYWTMDSKELGYDLAVGSRVQFKWKKKTFRGELVYVDISEKRRASRMVEVRCDGFRKIDRLKMSNLQLILLK
jgi:hypothetical protein